MVIAPAAVCIAWIEASTTTESRQTSRQQTLACFALGDEPPPYSLNTSSCNSGGYFRCVVLLAAWQPATYIKALAVPTRQEKIHSACLGTPQHHDRHTSVCAAKETKLSTHGNAMPYMVAPLQGRQTMQTHSYRRHATYSTRWVVLVNLAISEWHHSGVKSPCLCRGRPHMCMHCSSVTCKVHIQHLMSCRDAAALKRQQATLAAS
jgi:hypothetical protein